MHFLFILRVTQSVHYILVWPPSVHYIFTVTGSQQDRKNSSDPAALCRMRITNTTTKQQDPGLEEALEQ